MRDIIIAFSSMAIAASSLAQPAPLEQSVDLFKEGWPGPFRFGYAILGDLPNGMPSISKNDKGHAVYHERSAMFSASDNSIYFAWGIDCAAGTRYLVATGPIVSMRPTAEPVVSDIRSLPFQPHTLAAFRKVCETINAPVTSW